MIVGHDLAREALTRPEHTRLRPPASAAFTPRRTAELAPRIEQITHDLMDALPPTGRGDLVEAFKAALPATVNAELLGVPEMRRLDFRRWSAHALRVASPEHRPAQAGLHAVPAGRGGTRGHGHDAAAATRRRTSNWETTIALRTLLSRVPELELAAPADYLEWIGSGIIRGVLSLPVRYRVG